MKINVTVTETKCVDLAIAECHVFARYWEDSELNGTPDHPKHPKMPCLEFASSGGYQQLAWCPIINLDSGKILNWPLGKTATIHYKSCDENQVLLYDRTGHLVKQYQGYVPSFLCPRGDGFGDYVKMKIDGNGVIQDFHPDLTDIFSNE